MAIWISGGVIAGLQSMGAAGIGFLGNFMLGTAGVGIGSFITLLITGDDCQK